MAKRVGKVANRAYRPKQWRIMDLLASLLWALIIAGVCALVSKEWSTVMACSGATLALMLLYYSFTPIRQFLVLGDQILLDQAEPDQIAYEKALSDAQIPEQRAQAEQDLLAVMERTHKHEY